MTVQEWLSGKGNYNDGVRLLAKHTQNKELVRFFENESAINRMKLRIHLANLSKQKPPTKPSENKPVRKQVQISDKVIDSSPGKSLQTKKPISFYPSELHETYQLRISSFLKASSLKVQLNNVPEENDEEALELQNQIWEQLEINKKCWEILDHYDTTGQALPTKSKNDFSDLSAQELVNQRQRLYANVSKRKKTIENIEKQITSETKLGKLERLKNKLLQKQLELQELQNDIDKLSKMING